MSTTRNVKERTWFISKKRTLHLHKPGKGREFFDYGLVKSAALPPRAGKYPCVVLLIGSGKYNNEKYRVRVSSYVHCPSSHEGLASPVSGRRHQILNFALCDKFQLFYLMNFTFSCDAETSSRDRVSKRCVCVFLCQRTTSWTSSLSLPRCAKKKYILIFIFPQEIVVH